MSDAGFLSDEARIIETILYIENNPVSLERLIALSKLDKDTVLDSLYELKQNYEDRNSGLILLEEDSMYSFQPSPDLYPKLRQSYGRRVDRRLSKAALETLAIVAYSQPITKGEIDKLRGVRSSDSIVRLLRDREYIKVSGRADTPGHPCLYWTTRKFLYEFKLKSIAELPKLSEVDRLRFTKEDEDQGELL